MSRLKRLVVEIHRRSLWQVLLIYVGAAWACFELIDAITERFGLPEWLPALAVVLFLLGLPFVVATACVRDVPALAGLAAEAEEGEVSETAAARLETGRRHHFLTWRNAAAIFVIVLATWGIMASAWLIFGRRSGEAQFEGKSIAVLPFENLSGEEDAEAFTNGIHDDILTHLSKIADLKVISRTSVLEYRHTVKNVRQIAEELDVATVLEGGVQRAGDRVRVNVQLIDAETDVHLWAETYDRELSTENVFTIQSDVATRIAAALEASLTPDEQRQLEVRPTDNLEAYESYLTGLEYSRRRGWDNWGIALEMFERALELDPDFALAHAWLSQVQLNLYYFADPTAERLATAKAAADRAIALDPDLPEAHYALGLYYYWGFLDYDSALEHYERARELNPNDGRVHHLMAIVYRRKGEWERALSNHETAVELSPRDPRVIGESGTSYWFLRDYERALELFDRAIAIEPSSSFFYQWKVVACLDYARVEEAWRTIEAMHDRTGRRFFSIVGVLSRPIMRVFDERFREELHDLSTRGYWLSKAQSYQLADDSERSRVYYDSLRVAMETVIREHPEWDEDWEYHSNLAVAYAGIGSKTDALREAERALELHSMGKDALIGTYPILGLAEVNVMLGDYGAAIGQIEYLLSIPSPISVTLLEIDPLWAPLHDQPRFQALLDKYE